MLTAILLSLSLAAPSATWRADTDVGLVVVDIGKVAP